MTAFAPLAAVGEFFLLRNAERTVRAYGPAQRDRMARHHAAGDRRFRSARRLIDPGPAALLLREAILCYLRASAIALAPDDALAPEALASAVPAVSADPVAPHVAEDTHRVRRAIGSADPLFFDSLDRNELELTRSALERAASMMRGATEVRSTEHLRGTRFGRLAGCALLVIAAAYHVARWKFWPDLAHGKPVTASSVNGLPDLHGLVDGDLGKTSFGGATRVESNPWISIDLQSVFKISTVRVYNRVDGWFDDNLPLVLQISVDGVRWEDVGRRDTTFGHAPPWTVDLPRRPARFVRVHGVGSMAIVLTEIEVFGGK
jgi:F5/8 type C domain-containing protein